MRLLRSSVSTEPTDSSRTCSRDDEVDVVYIGTPHSTHAALAVRALEAGKHVLVEKPLAANADELQMVIDAARRHGRFAMEGMWMKFHSYYRALLAELRSGGIGEVSSIRASFGLPFGEVDAPRWSAELASSTLLDQGIYPVTLGMRRLRTARRRSRPGDGSGPTASTSTSKRRLTFEDGRSAHLAASMVRYVDPSASINGTSGWITVPAPFWATDRYVRHIGSIPDALMSPSTAEFTREGMGYVAMLRAVQDAIASGLTEHPLHPLDDTLAVARTLDSIRDAAHLPMTATALETHR